ncbi:nuclear cap-binding protein subunit 1-like [Anneissia japonica]|uniref:nuclear cap-binding protein subunit 1-like n=1 Tax=Anneissia japonica TaxID=1529436 RepID=UPI001425859D|nr:nuclear cap-binding protein subunit 1-like [Anneissia japonica]
MEAAMIVCLAEVEAKKAPPILPARVLARSSKKIKSIAFDKRKDYLFCTVLVCLICWEVNFLNMSRRRKYSVDDDDVAQPFNKRRKSVHDEIEERLESLITRVGEKSTSSLESNLEGLAGVLEADVPNYKHKIIDILSICASDLPEKTTVYTTLVGLLNTKNYNCGREFVENLLRKLKEALKACDWIRSHTMIRFMSDLVNCHVVDHSSIIAMYETFLSATQEDGVPQVRMDWFVYVVLSSLPWSAHELHDKKPQELNKILNTIEKYIGQRKHNHMAMLRVWMLDAPHRQEDYIDSLWAQIGKMRRDKWTEKIIQRPYLAFDGVMSEALQHTLPKFTLPLHSPEILYQPPKVVFRMFDYTDVPEGSPTLPGIHSVERYLVEDHLGIIIENFWKERKECAAQLVSFHAKHKVPLNYMIVEVLFSQFFRLPSSPRIEIFYTTLFLELCKLQPSSLPQVLAQAAEMMFERLDSMNLSLIDRFINWFAHHLSNFQFRWSWDDWTDCLNSDPELPKPKFIKEVLKKCRRLSYHQRIMDNVPESFSLLFPKEPKPVYKYKLEGASQLPGNMMAHQLIDAFKSRATPDDVIKLLKDTPNPNKDEYAFDDDSGFNPVKIDVFVQTLFNLGSKSFSHSFSALAKFYPVLKSLADSQEAQVYILRMLHELWCNHEQMIIVLVDKMLRTQIVECASVVNWLFSVEMRDQFTSMYMWEILHLTIRIMNNHVGELESELKSSHKKQHRVGKDSDDSESEEDMETTESHLEGLQESLEATQSDQKNLFLIIFQRFIMTLSEHIVQCENRNVPFRTPWFNYAIQRLAEIFTMHYSQVFKYITTLESLIFTSDIDSNILEVFNQFRAMTS